MNSGESVSAPSVEGAGSSRWRAIRSNLFAWPTALTVLVLVGLELLLRALAYPPAESRTALAVDPFTLWEMPPGERVEEGVRVKVNSLGLRGPELVMPKPAGIKRILTLGDSSIYGFGVPDGAVFSSVLAEALGPSVEVVNGGVGGYSTVQTLRRLVRKGPSIQPDLLVVGVLWSDNNFDSFVDKELLLEFEGAHYERISRMHETLSRSALFRTLDFWLRGRRQRRQARPLKWMLGENVKLGRRRVEINDYAQNLEAIVAEGRRQGCDTVFVLLANRDDVSAVSIAEAAWNPYRQVMRDMARRHGAPLLDVVSLFKKSGLSPEALFWDAMHPTVAGHALIGQALSELLLERGWPEKPVMLGGSDEAIPTYTDPFVTPLSVPGTGAGPEGEGGRMMPQANLGQAPSGPVDPLHPLGPFPAGPDGLVPAGSSPARSSPVSTSPVGSSPARFISGVLVGDVQAGATLQVDLMGPARQILAIQRLSQVGPFRLPAGAMAGMSLRVMIDLESDGPAPGDPSYVFEQTLIDTTGGSIEGVTIDLRGQQVILPGP